jgi:S-DNA-T family DNA segregation ATPase FtsK/SpoIIIE
MDQLEKAGVVGAAHGGKPRDVLISDEMNLENFLSLL